MRALTPKRRAAVLGAIEMLIVSAMAQDPFARASVSAKGDIYTGQRVTLVVELLAPGYFSGAPSFDLPNVPGVLLVPPRASPTVGNETVKGFSFTVQRHELSVFARRAGEIEIPAFTARFAFKRQPLDKRAVPASVSTTVVKFTAKSPPGSEGLGNVLSARELTATEVWRPEPGKAKTGDAFTRTITFAAPDVPAMAFPPFPAPKVEGLGVYPKSPEVLDTSDRGNLHGQRRDSVTYVCQKPGRFVIPGARLTWFDLDTKTLKVIDFPERVLEVAANPSMASTVEATSSQKAFTWRAVGIATVVLAVGGALAWLGYRYGARFIRPFRAVHLAPLNPGPAGKKV